jgi:hypothetical protein
MKIDGLGWTMIFLGFIPLGFAIAGLFTGNALFYVPHGSMKMQRWKRKREPISFWVVTSIQMLVGLALIIWGLRQ